MAQQLPPDQELKQLVDYFKDLRLKCYGLQESCPARHFNLSKFDSAEAVVLAKIKNLSELSFVDCKATLTRAIDELLEIQSQLSLLKIRERERPPCASSSQQKQASPSKQQRTPEVARFNALTPTPSRPEKIAKIVNDFKHNELIDIWKSNRQTESASDELDRLNRLVINLTCKVKGVIKDEQTDISKIRMYMLPEFTRVLEELERYKMMNEELLLRNDALRDELLKVKAEIFVSKYRPRYYRPGLKEFGCGTDQIAPLEAQSVHTITTKFEPLTIKWTDFIGDQNINPDDCGRKTLHFPLLEDSKDEISESLLIDADESSMGNSKLTYTNSEKSLKIVANPNVCKQLQLNQSQQQRMPQFPPRNIVKLGIKR